jgi:hypothetical protein
MQFKVVGVAQNFTSLKKIQAHGIEQLLQLQI